MKWQKPCGGGEIFADDEIYYSIDSKNKQHNKQTSAKKSSLERVNWAGYSREEILQ